MENREDLKSILSFLPVGLRSSSLFWPSQVVEGLKTLSRGPEHSRVDSGEVLFLALSDIRDSLGLSPESLAYSAAEGYALFFDELLSRVESRKWFSEVLPSLAALLLRFPSLLEIHYKNADILLGGVKTSLRVIRPQEAGIVFLSQELIGALLTCSLFCLFPITNRYAEDLPDINFDQLFASITNHSENQEHKIKCLIHYFERICSCMPTGCVSFERKVLSWKHVPSSVSYPNTDFWSKSIVRLCCFEVSHSGLIEDQLCESLEVDFANKYIGGGALRRGCVQEEIRFMINPELIAGMLFLPSMADNEAIEIFGAERFSSYTGYASSFRFVGDYVDGKTLDFMGRRKTRIVAIDALCNPRMRQYRPECLLREINKAFCGFFEQSNLHLCQDAFQVEAFCGDKPAEEVEGFSDRAGSVQMDKPLSSAEGLNDGASIAVLINETHIEQSRQAEEPQNDIGIVTGNWGCGAFGGDPELKTIIQWLAASQACRPFILYCTFGEHALQNIEQVTKWIVLHEWTIGDLWNMLSEYSSQRLKGKTDTGFFTWLLPSMTTCCSMI